MNITERIDQMLSEDDGLEEARRASDPLDNALDIGNMPEGKNWMKIAPDVLDQLSGREAKEALSYLLTQGQDEHKAFYNGLVKAVGVNKSIEMVEKAKKM